MSDRQQAGVYYHPFAEELQPGVSHSYLASVTGRLLDQLKLNGDSADSWALKIQLGAPNRPPAIAPDLAAAATAKLKSGSGVDEVICFDTLSITTEGLHTAEKQLSAARLKGYGNNTGVGFQVADDPQRGPAQELPSPLTHPSGRPGRSALLAAGLKKAGGLLALSCVSAHPHLGFQGALSSLILGCSDRQGKLDLHRDIRPQVDTPLCAGCGSCLVVCVFDAIDLKAGRAVINHQKCTGCGECMTVCHLAGIAVENSSRLTAYQEQLAEAGLAIRQGHTWSGEGRMGFVNYLIHLDRRDNRSAPRSLGRPKHLGVLAARDPVALDQATWDLICRYTGADLAAWCGYPQNPGTLLEKAESLGLGSRDYRLIQQD